MRPKRMPTVNFKLLHRLLKTSVRLGHYLKYHLNDSVVPSNAWNRSVLIIVWWCLKDSKRSFNSFLICSESKLRMKFDFYCDSTNKRCNFCSCLNIPQQYSLIPTRLDYETGCLETGYLFRVTLCHTLRHTDIMNGTSYLKHLLNIDSSHLNPMWQLHVQCKLL